MPEQYAADEDIRFYLQANPLFKQGHGLLTITPMNLMNAGKLLNRSVLKLFGWKVVKRAVTIQPA